VNAVKHHLCNYREF